jgi:cytidylate kinase
MTHVIALDGPAGSGKSTTAKEVARRLGVPHVESGALYRSLTLAALDGGVQFNGQMLVALAKSLPVRLTLTDMGVRPEVAGADVSEAIRGARVTERVSELSALPEVREWVNEQVREAVARHPGNVAVLDGRDIGTVVFPEATLKFFLVARPEERARRRLLQNGETPDADRIAATVADLERRDKADSSRAVGPLKAAPDAILLDTSDLAFEDQVNLIVTEARKAFS